MKKLALVMALPFFLLSFSCTSENISEENVNGNLLEKKQIYSEPLKLTEEQREDVKVEFAKALSAVLYSNSEARRIIKSEAVKQFDKNYDVLWSTIRDVRVGDSSFVDHIATYSSKELVSIIDNQIPLLNILFPEISMFDISADTYNYMDIELPVAVSSNGKNLLYVAGELTDTIPNGEIPAFHVLFVGENSRVEVDETSNTRSSNHKYSFISPSYDGTRTQKWTRGAIVGKSLVGDKAIRAYNFFYKDDSSINSMALQRDFIYYGITPTNQSGALNYNTGEYISFIEVSPKAYFRIADQTGTGSISDDPYIKANSISRKKQDFTQEELIDKLWTKGSYNLRFEIQRSTNDAPQVIYIPVKPSEIWNFNLDRSYRHSTALRHSKYTYKIDPNKFTSKRYNLSPYELSFGKWNLAEEAVYRYVTIQEEDESTETTTTYNYEVTKMKSSKFNGDTKLELGLGKATVGTGVSVETSSANTTKDTRTVVVVRKEGSDNLGSVKIFFYDPIIEAKKSSTEYQMRTYNSGYVTFGISAY